MTSYVTYHIDWDAPMGSANQSVARYNYSVTVNGMNMGSFDVFSNGCDITVQQGCSINFTVAAIDNYNQRGADSTLSFNSDIDPINLIPMPYGAVTGLRYTLVNFS
jgi:hypothetical protein